MQYWDGDIGYGCEMVLLRVLIYVVTVVVELRSRVKKRCEDEAESVG